MDDIHTSIRLPADLMRHVDAEADTDMRTRSSMLRVLLTEALARREERREERRSERARECSLGAEGAS